MLEALLEQKRSGSISGIHGRLVTVKRLLQILSSSELHGGRVVFM